MTLKEFKEYTAGFDGNTTALFITQAGREFEIDTLRFEDNGPAIILLSSDAPEEI